MKSKKGSALQSANRAVRDSAHDAYCTILHLLAKDHDYEGSPYRSLPGFLRGRDYKGLLSWADSLLEQKYPSATEHFVASQFASLIRKYPWDPKVVGTNPEETAVQTFFKSERKCARMNRKFKLYRSLRVPAKHWHAYGQLRSYIRYILGEGPNLRRIFQSVEFGSGASVGVHGNATNVWRKLSAERWTCTYGASQFALVSFLEHAQLREILSSQRGMYWCDDPEAQKAAFLEKREIVGYNMVTFVPKTAKTHRAIAVEPLLNGLIQKGIDTEMRLLLKRVRLDLSDQSRNQKWAHSGSMDDSEEGFVTVDLSSASDSISIELCRLLLPDAWFDLLNRTRSHSYMLRGEVKPYHKFCSMGNGFCFPLETLLFAAVCHAAGGGIAGQDFSVYGDDIIVRKKHARDVLALLRELGFTPNSKKTLIEGPFRESCGGDFYNGEDVRPYTLDEKLESIPALFKFLNLTRRSERTAHFFRCTREFILASIPARFRMVRPFQGTPDTGIDSVGDEHLRFPGCRFIPSSKRKVVQQVWRWREFMHTPVRDKYAVGCQAQMQIEVYALLRGTRSSKSHDFDESPDVVLTPSGGVEFAVRRKTRTTTITVERGGPGSSWVPVQSRC